MDKYVNYNIENLDSIQGKEKRQITMVGTKVSEWNSIYDFCNIHNIKYNVVGGKETTKVDIQTNEKLTQESFMAPTIQMKWQVENGYIPCRIFKNISYGKMGITNSETVYNLFEKNILYDSDIKKVLEKGLEFENNPREYKKQIIISLMKVVRDKHTYINRMQTILECLQKQQ